MDFLILLLRLVYGENECLKREGTGYSALTPCVEKWSKLSCTWKTILVFTPVVNVEQLMPRNFAPWCSAYLLPLHKHVFSVFGNVALITTHRPSKNLKSTLWLMRLLGRSFGEKCHPKSVYETYSPINWGNNISVITLCSWSQIL